MRAWLAVALAAGCGEVVADDADFDGDMPACGSAGIHCMARVRTRGGEVPALASPSGFAPADLQAAYGIDATRGQGTTVAIIDAYGYPTLEADLAMYRSQFGLPPCTTASGCLRVLNESGEPSPLPAEGSELLGWTVETALDLDMVSAACPLCGIVVVETSGVGDDFYTAEVVASRSGATVISDSWGSPEQGNEGSIEPSFDHPGIATFASTGDSGYNDGSPIYPSTSAHVIAVGGTTLTRDANAARGFAETAWSSSGSSVQQRHREAQLRVDDVGLQQLRAAADVLGDRRSEERRRGVRHQRWHVGMGRPRWHERGVAAGRGDVRGGGARRHHRAVRVRPRERVHRHRDRHQRRLRHGDGRRRQRLGRPDRDGHARPGRDRPDRQRRVAGAGVHVAERRRDGAAWVHDQTWTAATGTQYVEIYVDGARIAAADRFPLVLPTGSSRSSPRARISSSRSAMTKTTTAARRRSP